MKKIFYLLSCILFLPAFGQFGIIIDNDGFVNVRNSPNIDNNVINTLKNNQIVYCLENEGEWISIDYHLNEKNVKTGYIHNSRIKKINNFYKIPLVKKTDTSVIFKKDQIRIILSSKKFNQMTNKLKYSKGVSLKNEIKWLEQINGKAIWGTDGNIPNYQYNQIILNIGSDKINLPCENLFEPNLENTAVYFDEKKNTIYITALNGDGAGSYAVLWVIKNSKFIDRFITIPF